VLLSLQKSFEMLETQLVYSLQACQTCSSGHGSKRKLFFCSEETRDAGRFVYLVFVSVFVPMIISPVVFMVRVKTASETLRNPDPHPNIVGNGNYDSSIRSNQNLVRDPHSTTPTVSFCVQSAERVGISNT